MGKPNDVARPAFQPQRKHRRFSVRYPVQVKSLPGDALPGIHAVSNNISIGGVLLETDAPFLAPVPFRGQTCEPKHTVATAEFLANLRGQSVEELSKATTANAVRLFNLS